MRHSFAMSTRRTTLSLLALVCVFSSACEDAGHSESTDARKTADANTDASVDGDAALGAETGISDGGEGSYCPVVGYSACGGDLTGTWSFDALCPEDAEAAAALCEHPYDDREVCQGDGNEATCRGQQAGTLVFHSDGTLSIDTELTLYTAWNFTHACLEAVARGGSTPAERCASLTTERLTCSYDAQCTCIGKPIVQADSNTSTYKVSGQDVTLGDDPPASYCVEGDTLIMDYYLYHPVSWRYWVLHR